ncbi:hypothetical protein QM259_15280 [Acinetobacter baumannii]|uniref:hypothetical protein n=1 Tax=Acinetobacter baumannii TaxID=470 RepID=UPI0024B6D097|nr:hypothetical protein [Acinetobacter baumannii]MDI9733627.1 hypothetical protein [Acinetobacter baumannii]
MATVNPVNRRHSTESIDARGVNFDLEKMKKGLSSKIIDLPKHQSIEERTTWLWEMMEKRKVKA